MIYKTQSLIIMLYTNTKYWRIQKYRRTYKTSVSKKIYAPTKHRYPQRLADLENISGRKGWQIWKTLATAKVGGLGKHWRPQRLQDLENIGGRKGWRTWKRLAAAKVGRFGKHWRPQRLGEMQKSLLTVRLSRICKC
jgi:hypothetical protein